MRTFKVSPVGCPEYWVTFDYTFDGSSTPLENFCVDPRRDAYMHTFWDRAPGYLRTLVNRHTDDPDSRRIQAAVECAVMEPKGPVYATAFSFCSDYDTWDRAKGERLALMRALGKTGITGEARSAIMRAWYESYVATSKPTPASPVVPPSTADLFDPPDNPYQVPLNKVRIPDGYELDGDLAKPATWFRVIQNNSEVVLGDRSDADKGHICRHGGFLLGEKRIIVRKVVAPAMPATPAMPTYQTVSNAYGRPLTEVTIPEGWEVDGDTTNPSTWYRPLKRGENFVSALDNSRVVKCFYDAGNWRIVVRRKTPPKPATRTIRVLICEAEIGADGYAVLRQSKIRSPYKAEYYTERYPGDWRIEERTIPA